MHIRALKRIVFIWILLIVFVALVGRVTIAATNAGQNAADFLLIGVGANAAGMGGAYSAVSNGVAGVYWNPAGMVGMERAEISLSHFAWYQDIKLEHGAIAFPLGERFVAATSITFLNYGTIDGYDINGASTGQISAYDWAGGISLAYGITSSISVGVTGKLVNEKLADITASTLAGDFGAKYQTDRFAAALVLANFGPTMQFEKYNEKLPSLMRAAVAVAPFGSNFLTSLELEKKQYGDMIVRQGVQLSFSEQYYLRCGYSYYPSDELRRFGSGLSLGAGLRFSRAAIDYAYTTKDSYTSEDLHRFSLTLSIGK